MAFLPCFPSLEFKGRTTENTEKYRKTQDEENTLSSHEGSKRTFQALRFKLLLQTLYIRRPRDSFLRNDGRDEFVRRNIEGVITYRSFIRGKLDILHVERGVRFANDGRGVTWCAGAFCSAAPSNCRRTAWSGVK